MGCLKGEYTHDSLENIKSVIDSSLNKLQGTPADKVRFAGITLARIYLINDILVEDASNLINEKLENSIPVDDIKSILSLEIKTRQERPSEKYTRLLKKLFDDDNMVYIRNQQFRRSMFSNLFINVNPTFNLSLSLRIVDGDEALCKNIESQFNTWFLEIAKYFGDNSTRYFKNHERTPESYDLLIQMRRELQNDPDVKNRLKNGYYSFIKGEDLELDFYNAVNAYLNIVYFDQILGSQYKSIIISRQSNPKEGNSFKYSFVKSGADLLKHGWNDKDSIIDVVKEMGGLVQSTIESIPLYDYRGSENKTKFYSYLTKEVFVNAITSIFDVISTSNVSSLRKIQQLLEEFPDDPDKLELILDLIFEKKGSESYLCKELNKHNITDNQLNVLHSVRQALYIPRGEHNPNYSYSEIENAYKKSNGINNRDSVVDAITNFIAGMSKMHYIKTEISDGKVTSSEISEVTNNRDRFNIISRLNAYKIVGNQTKQQKINQYKFKVDGNINITLRSGLKISFPKNIFKTKYSELSKEDIRFDGNIVDYFNDTINLLKTTEGIKHLLSGENLSQKESEFKELIDIIDDVLNLNLGKSEFGLNQLYLLLNAPNLSLNNPNKVLNNLIFTTLKVLSNMDLISDIEDNPNYEVTEVSEYIKNEKWHEMDINMDDESIRKYMTTSKFDKQFKMVDSSDAWINGYQYALNVLQGNFDKSVLDDPSGNKIPKYSNVFLAAKFKSIMAKVKKNLDHVCYGLSLNQGRNSDAILNCVIDTYITIHDLQKAIQDLTHGELEMHAIIDLFYATLNTGKVVLQPTDPSDKRKIPKYLVDLSKYVIDGKLTLESARGNRNKIRTKIFEDFASYYSKMLLNTLDKYRVIFDNPNLTVNEVQLLLKLQSATVIWAHPGTGKTWMHEHGRRDIIDFDSEYKSRLGNLQEREILKNKIGKEVYNKKLDELFEEAKKQAIKTGRKLLVSDMHFLRDRNNEIDVVTNISEAEFLERSRQRGEYDEMNKKEWKNSIDSALKNIPINKVINTTGYISDLLPEQNLVESKTGKIYNLTRLAFTKGIELVENVDYIVNKGGVELNPLLLYYTEVLIKNPDTFYENLRQNENDFVKDLLKDDVKFKLGESSLHIREYLEQFVGKSYLQWVDSNGSMILKNDSGLINPLIDYYFLTATLVENALRLTMFDSEVSHTVKRYNPVVGEDGQTYSPSDYILTFKKAPDSIYDIRDAAIIASTKRAGQLSSTLISLKQKQLNGIRPNIKVAVVEDFETDVFTPEKAQDDLKAHDGGGFILSFLKYQEDNALLENKVGLIRKPILAWKNPLTGSSVQFKYAVNTLTNRFMRNSVNSSLDTYLLFKRMTSLFKFNVDLLLNDAKANGRISFKNDILEGNEAYYWYIDSKDLIKKFRQIVDFGFDPEKQLYYTVEKDCNAQGIALSDEFNVYHNISTIYELYEAMGGLNSVELINKNLVDSEVSSLLVSNFMNNVNILKEGIDPKQAKPTLNYYDQPLKDAVIYCLLPHSAVKDGVANINPSIVYNKNNNDALTFMTVGTDHYGPQNDSDHDADESEVNELTQVMSSLDNGGTMHSSNKLFYQVLGKTIEIFSRVPRSVVTRYRNNNDRNGLYRFMAELIIDNFDINKTDSTLGQQIIDKLAKELDKYDDQDLVDLHFPFSDKNVYDIIANTVTSILNKTAIKKQFSGGGMPMAPGFGFLQIYEIEGKTYQFNDLVNLISNDKNKIAELYKVNGLKYSTLSGIELNKELVNDYLASLSSPLISINEIQPSDVLHFYLNGTLLNPQGFAITNLNDYYSLMSNPTGFLKAKNLIPENLLVSDNVITYQRSVVTPRDLAPDKIWVRYKDSLGLSNVVTFFNMWPIKNRFLVESALTIEEIERLVGYKNFSGLSFEEFKQSAIKHLIRERDKLLKDIEDNHVYTDENGVKYEVESIEKKNFEGIFSNINAKKFGLTERSSMIDVINQGSSAFNHYLADIEETNPKSFTFQLRLVSSASDLQDTYISFDPNFYNKHANKIRQRELREKSKNFDLDKEKSVFQEIYSKSNDGDKQFLIGVLILDKTITKSEDGLYRRGDVILDSKNLETIKIGDNQYVIENVYFTDRYEVDSVYDVININYKNIEKYISVLNSTKKVREKINDVIGSILGDIYSSEDYETIYVNNHINKRLLQPISDNLFNLQKNLGYNKPLLTYILKLSNFLSQIKSDEDNVSIYDYSNEQGETLTTYFNEYDDLRAKAMYSSFLKSLEFVVARIPSQTLQSFMKMNCVGFTQSPKNECYVSHFQTYLQGSDYDYDKAYTLGYSISNQGVFVGWSNMFDYYSLKTLNESLKIPYSIRNVKIRFGKINNQELISLLDAVKINRELVERLKQQFIEEDNNKILENNIITLIKSEIALLNYIDSHVDENGEFTLPNDYDSTITSLIKGHYDLDKIPIKQRENMLRNYVVNHIGNVITYLPNVVSAHTPVTMDDIRGSAKYAEIKDESHLSFLNPAAKLKMQYKNAVGKKGTGISANGEKVSFNWHYYFREKLSGGSIAPFFKFDASRIIGRHNDTMSENNIIQCLPDVKLEDFEGKGYDVLDQMIRNIRNNRGLVTGNITVDNAISQILSASTDNAKELILEKINGNENLLKCHLLLIALGIPLNDVAAFMSSPAVYWIAKVTQGNIYYGGSRLSMENAINMVLNPQEESQEDQVPPEILESISKEEIAHIPTEAELNRMTTVHNTLRDFKKDLEQFRIVLQAANEFTNGARLLRLNQGVPGKDYFELVDFINSIKDMLTTAEGNKGKDELQSIREEFMKDNEITAKAAKFNPDKFSIDKWLRDYNYRLLTAKYYEKLKTVVNLFDLLNNLPHFSKMLSVLDIANELTETPVLKNKVQKRIVEKLKESKYYLTDSLKKKIPKYIDSKLIAYYLRKNQFSIPLPTNTMIFNEYWDKVELNDSKLVLKDDMSAANFKYIFESFIIPQLKQGIFYVNNNKETNERRAEDIRNNTFIRSLILDDDLDGIPYYKLDIDTSNLKKRFITSDFNDTINQLKQSFKTLSKYSLGVMNPVLGRELNLQDLFVIYNLIVNRNRPGRNTLTSILDLDDKNGLIVDYEKMIGDLDYNSINMNADELLELLNYSEEDFLLSTAKEIKSLDSRTKEPIVYIDTPSGRKYYTNNLRGKNFYLNVDLNSLTGANRHSKAIKLQNMISYSVLSTNYSVYLNLKLSMLDLDNMFSSDIDNETKEDRLNAAINSLSDKIRYNQLIITLNC